MNFFKNSILVFLLTIPIWGFSQTGIDTLKESKHLPAFKFYTLKDSLSFTPDSLPIKRPILFIYFNTTCDHCQHETEELLKYITYFEKISIVLVSREDRKPIQNFAKKYELAKNGITVLMDSEGKIHDYFDFAYIPMIRLYNKKRQLIAAYSEQAHILDILTKFEED